MAAIMVMVAAPASAATSTQFATPGGYATYDNVANTMRVVDNFDELVGDWGVYARFCWTNSSTQSSCSSSYRLDNNNGAGTAITFYLNPAGTRIVFRACRAVPLGPDNCSGWTNFSA
jgi:hypothetical protein